MGDRLTRETTSRSAIGSSTGDTQFDVRTRTPSDLAVIAYTSGTTGRPKGAMQSQRAVVAAGVGTALMAARTADDRVVSALPLFHVYGSCVMNAAMLAGSMLITLPRFSEVGHARPRSPPTAPR